MNILVNLPDGFFQHPDLVPQFDRLRKLGNLTCTSHDTDDQIRGDLAAAEAVIMWSWPPLTDELLDQAPNLKYRGQLDITQDAAATGLKRDVPISLSRSGWSPAVSEMALTLMLACLRRTSDYHAAMRAGTESWVEAFPTDIDVRERQLTGRRVGIVGLGRIGKRLAELLMPFNIELLVADPYIPEEALKPFNAKRVDIDTLCKESEIVVLCAAANDGTKHLIGQSQIDSMAPNAILLNVARAALVDMDALTNRLKKGDLIAAVDVFETEPLPTDSPLRQLPNLYLTPHRSGGVMESVQRCIGWLIDDLEAVLAGKPQKYPVVEAMLPSLDK
ncbi:MAG: NAD(P)-dependent oxidoreductase [Algisphaera sp.]